MGPTNVALLNLFRADQQFRQAEARLDAAQRSVRIQERRVNDAAEKLKLARATLRERQARAAQFDLDLRSRDAHIEKLRVQQQVTHNNKEYQAFLIEISTGKVDRAKVEEEAIKEMGLVERTQAEVVAAEAQAAQERAKLDEMKAQIGGEVARLQSEVDALRPARDAAAAAVPPRALKEFERLAEHHEGEAMAAISKPDRRREEYLCTTCNMELVRDIYNKLRMRDEVVHCPSCRRILYIPENLSPEEALGGKSAVKRTRTATPRATRTKAATAGPAAGDAAGAEAGAEDASGEVVIELRAKGKLGEVLAKAQGETVRSANAADQRPVDCEVMVDGELAGIYKGQSADRLERAIKYFMGQAAMTADVHVRLVPVAAPEEAATPPAGDAAEAPATASSAGEVQTTAPAPEATMPEPASSEPALTETASSLAGAPASHPTDV